MGKRLIIKNADFSANGILTVPVRLIDLLNNIVIGNQWSTGTQLQLNASPNLVSTTNDKRAGNSDYVAISNYGFETITITAKTGYKFACYFGDTNVSGVNNSNITNWGYTDSGNSLQLDISACSYAVIMVCASNGTDTLTSDDLNDYISIVES